MTVSDLR